MKKLKWLAVTAIVTTFLAAPWAAWSVDSKTDKKPAKPYPLKTCVVSDEKLGDHGEPYVFTHEGREIKMCCKGCLKDFKKETAKYIKKLEAAEKKNKQPGA